VFYVPLHYFHTRQSALQRSDVNSRDLPAPPMRELEIVREVHSRLPSLNGIALALRPVRITIIYLQYIGHTPSSHEVIKQDGCLTVVPVEPDFVSSHDRSIGFSVLEPGVFVVDPSGFADSWSTDVGAVVDFSVF